MADNPALLSLLGMCRRAQKLSCGHDASVGSIRCGAAQLCLLSSDSSERLREEINREISMKSAEIPVIVLDSTMDEIGKATALRSAVITVNDAGFAKSALRHLNDGRKLNV